MQKARSKKTKVNNSDAATISASVTIPKELLDEIDRLAADSYRSRSAFIVMLLAEEMKRRGVSA